MDLFDPSLRVKKKGGSFFVPMNSPTPYLEEGIMLGPVSLQGRVTRLGENLTLQ